MNKKSLLEKEERKLGKKNHVERSEEERKSAGCYEEERENESLCGKNNWV